MTTLTSPSGKKQVMIIDRKDGEYDMYFSFLFQNGNDSQCIDRKTYKSMKMVEKKTQIFFGQAD